jgi:Fic family protein
VAMKLGVSRETVNKNLAVLLKKKLIKKVNDHPHFTEFVCIKKILEP